MTNYHEVDRPPVLDPAEIQKLLSMRLIANLATIDDDGGIHLVPMRFLRVADDICTPTSRNTHKYDNIRKILLYSNLITMVQGIDLKPENLNPILEMKIEKRRIIQLLYCCFGIGR